MQDVNGDGSREGAGTGGSSVDEHKIGTGTGAWTETRAVAAEERKRKNRTRVVDAMWETGKTWVERGRNVENKGLVQQLPTQII